MKTLVLVEHDNASVKDATLAAVTAAAQLGEVTALVAGSNCDGAASAAAQIAGVAKVLKADDAALENALAALRGVASARGAGLTVLFGCGGDRDPGKRPQMGAIAARLADRVVLTSDNPRSEDPHAILAQVAAGAAGAEVVVDRATAIRAAILSAHPAEVILIAGKGHEPYQEIAGERRPFSDLGEAAAALAARRETQA